MDYDYDTLVPQQRLVRWDVGFSFGYPTYENVTLIRY